VIRIPFDLFFKRYSQKKEKVNFWKRICTMLLTCNRRLLFLGVLGLLSLPFHSSAFTVFPSPFVVSSGTNLGKTVDLVLKNNKAFVASNNGAHYYSHQQLYSTKDSETEPAVTGNNDGFLENMDQDIKELEALKKEFELNANGKVIETTMAFPSIDTSFVLDVQDMQDAVNLDNEGKAEHVSTWPSRLLQKDTSKQETTYADFVVTTKEEAENDPVLRIFSSELGVKELIRETKPSTQQDSGSSLPFDVLAERTFDTVEDIMVHLRRIPNEVGTKDLTAEEEETRKTVVILGSGWAAHAMMKVADCQKLRIIVVSPTNHFVFTPMLASAAVGTVEDRSMTEAVRAANPLVDQYIEGKATGVNVEEKTVTVKLNSLLEGVREVEAPTVELKYDHLIVSVGCRIDDKGVPGADKALRLKSANDAKKMRTAVGECFEYASRPDVAAPDQAEERTRRSTFMIVGGGATGVELAGELMDLAVDITRPHKGVYPKLRDYIRVILVHSGTDLVSQFDERLRAEALKSLRKRGVEVILNTRATEVGDGFAKLSTKIIDEDTGKVVGRDDYTMDVGLTVWCAGTAPVPFVDQLLQQLPESARNNDGRIKVDGYMRPSMHKKELLGSVLVLGDAAAVSTEKDNPIAYNALLPQTAQVAGQQGAYAARTLARGYDLTATPPILPSTQLGDDSSLGVFNDPGMKKWLEVRGLETAPKFKFLNLGLLAYLGGGEALSQVQVGDVPIFSYFGSVAFVLWRSVYLVKQVATRNRMLVTFDWLKSSLFGRDMTRF
jgi:NADH dehydrogenase FAD-containing subunit